MGRDTRDAYREPSRDGRRYDDDDARYGGASSSGAPSGGRDRRTSMAGPISRANAGGETLGPAAGGSGKRPVGGGSGGGGLLRPPAPAGDPDDERGYGASGRRAAQGRSGATPTPDGRAPMGRTSGPGTSDPRRTQAPGGYGEPDDDERYGGRSSSGRYGAPERGVSGGQRSMAEMARSVSQRVSSVSQQLSSVMSRAGQMVRDAGRDDRNYGFGRDDSAYRRTPGGSRAASDPRRAALAEQPTEKLNVSAYRRSRMRLVARKWRLRRVRPNPLGYFVGIAAVVALVVTVLAGGGAGGYYAVTYYYANVDKIQAVADLRNQTNTVILDRNGAVIATLRGTGDEYNIYVPLSQISPHLQAATIDVEDHTFYSNSGVDLVGTARAAVIDSLHGGAAQQGGSTITQQLVKLLVLHSSEKALSRKLHEAILAFGVTLNYDKQQILEMYLNEIDYGYPNKGIEAAASNYFGLQPITDPTTKQVTTANQQLQVWQAAMLAGVPNGPTIYKPDVFSCKAAPCTDDKWNNPYTSNAPGYLKCGAPYVDAWPVDSQNNVWYQTNGHEWLVYCRTKLVLDKMVQYGDLAASEEAGQLQKAHDALVNQDIHHTVSVARNGTLNDNLAPHFVQYVEAQLSDQFGIDQPETAGLRIYTTLDLSLNTYAQQSLHYYIDQSHKNPWYSTQEPPCGNLVCSLAGSKNANNGALMALDQYTGDILAMVGSVDYTNSDPRVAGNVNVTVSSRSLGSSVKPIVYATAFQMGWNGSTMLQDDPVCFPGGPTIDPTTKKPIQDVVSTACDGYYTPHDYETYVYAGRFPVRRVLANSLNIPATEALSFVGLTNATADGFMTMAHRFGVTQWDKAHLGPTTALGTQNTRLIDLTSAYTTFGNGGKRLPPRAILQIEDNSGHALYSAQKLTPIQVISPQVAYMMTSILTDNKARAADFGIFNPLHLDPTGATPSDNFSNLAVAAKTGTASGANGPSDIVTMGYTPYMTLGVWLGNDNNESMDGSIIGIAGAGYVFHDVMVWAAQHYKWDPNAQFPIPPHMAHGSFNCTTGLAPYKGATANDLNCQYSVPSYVTEHNKTNPKIKWGSADLYNADNGQTSHTNDDWYIQGTAPLQS